MQVFFFISFMLLIACSSHKAEQPSFSMAFDSLNDNKLQATATKRIEQDKICIDVSIISKDEDQQVHNSWKVVWIDEKEQQHEVKLPLRAPASHNVWKNDFTTCESNVKFHQVKAVIITPENEDEPSQQFQLRW